ncbi:unnamed protein product [Lactuca virosa]|uniref:Uncharacterized protein n=1 Tax=Lactuca virosa TaxID=75947 RepID=A0AAU9LTP6_9ASTR|nr:unnamed protein product [Lactuca virosa]
MILNYKAKLRDQACANGDENLKLPPSTNDFAVSISADCAASSISAGSATFLVKTPFLKPNYRIASKIDWSFVLHDVTWIWLINCSCSVWLEPDIHPICVAEGYRIASKIDVDHMQRISHMKKSKIGKASKRKDRFS